MLGCIRAGKHDTSCMTATGSVRLGLAHNQMLLSGWVCAGTFLFQEQPILRGVALPAGRRLVRYVCGRALQLHDADAGQRGWRPCRRERVCRHAVVPDTQDMIAHQAAEAEADIAVIAGQDIMWW